MGWNIATAAGELEALLMKSNDDLLKSLVTSTSASRRHHKQSGVKYISKLTYKHLRILFHFWLQLCAGYHSSVSVFFTARRYVLSAFMLRQFRLSVRLSYACAWIVSKRLNVSLKCFHCLIGPSFWFFVTKGCCVNLTALPLTGDKRTRRSSDFRPICGYMREKVIDRGIFIMEDEYKFVYALSNSAAFDDFEWPRTPVSRSQ